MSEAAAPHTAGLRVLCCIPARLQSHRLPRKMLREIAGKPLLAWTVEAARRCPQFQEVIVAVDSTEVADLCEANGWPWRMTDPTLPSGTDRLAVIAQAYAADVFVNLQGDEPLIQSTHIAALLQPFADADVDVSTLKIRCDGGEVRDPNAVKVVTAKDGRALYFSRATIPFDRDGSGAALPFKHLGLYAYRRTALERFAALPPSPLEQIERLEQLRLLEHGMHLHVAEVAEPTYGVDTEADAEHVATILRSRS